MFVKFLYTNKTKSVAVENRPNDQTANARDNSLVGQTIKSCQPPANDAEMLCKASRRQQRP